MYASGNVCVKFISTLFASTCSRRRSSLMLFSECLKVKSERHHDSGKNFDYGSYTKYTFYNHGPHAEKIIM